MVKVKFAYKHPKSRRIVHLDVVAETESEAYMRAPKEPPGQGRGYIFHGQVSAEVIPD